MNEEKITLTKEFLSEKKKRLRQLKKELNEQTFLGRCVITAYVVAALLYFFMPSAIMSDTSSKITACITFMLGGFFLAVKILRQEYPTTDMVRQLIHYETMNIDRAEKNLVKLENN